MLPRLNALFSYAFLRKGRAHGRMSQFEEYMIAISPYVDIMVDSGAFSDFVATRKALSDGSRHVPISVDEYISACKAYQNHVWQYVMLDVIENASASRKNLDTMVAAGLRPMPVFVFPESPEIVPELVDINPYVCVPGGVEGRLRFVRQRYQVVHKKSAGKALIHGLGFVRHPDMFQLPLASVDSSSWYGGGRFGNIAHYTPRNGFALSHWRELSQDRHPMLWRHLQRCGLRPSDLSDPAMYKRVISIPAMTFTFAYTQVHQHCYRHGMRYFFSVPNTNWMRQLLSVIATVDHRTNSFDYHQARALCDRVGELSRRNFSIFVEWSIDVLKRHTDWQTKIQLRQETSNV